MALRRYPTGSGPNGEQGPAGIALLFLISIGDDEGVGFLLFISAAASAYARESTQISTVQGRGKVKSGQISWEVAVH